MNDSFDPYYKWLGISPKDQPPNHYRLLAIELFESDPDVIEGAADQRMAHVRTFQAGQNSALSQRVLNELSAAKLCLLNQQTKADYDRELQGELQAEAPPAPLAEPQPGATPSPMADPSSLRQRTPFAIPLASAPSTGTLKRTAPKQPLWRRQQMILGAVGAAAILLAALVYYLATGGKAGVAQGDGAHIRPNSPQTAVPTVDLLKLIDVNRDAVQGDWRMIEGVLVSPDSPFSRLLLPAPSTPEYQLTIVAERVKGPCGLDVALAIDGRQVLANIDGVDGTFAGLGLIDGKNCRDNETGRHGRLLVDGQTATFSYTVRRNGIQVALDGRQVIDWRGDPVRLSLVEGYKLPDATRLAVCEYKTVLRIRKIELAPLISPASASSAPGPASGATQQIAPNHAAVEGK